MKKITNLSDLTSAENFGETAVGLYGSATGQLKRYADLYEAHCENFKFNNGGWFFSSPGRIEVVGNHTDHNRGKVLAAAINVDTLAFASPTDDDVVTVRSEGYDVFVCKLEDVSPTKGEEGTTMSLIKGVARYFKDNNFAVGGFSATVTGNVPMGAGVSSSASFEVLIAEIFNALYNDGKISGLKKAQAAQYAENVYFGKPCGLMDQCAVAIGGVSMIDFKNLDAPEVLNVNWPFSQVDIVITNTGGSHADLTDAYASIRFEMEEVAKYFGCETLRDVETSKFAYSLPDLQKHVSGRAILRAMHFFDENNRVERAVAAITYSNLDGFLKHVKDSGESSSTLLQNCCVDGDTEQRIPLALAASARIEGVRAVRVHGGGFAGTIIAYVEKSATVTYVARMEELFGKDNVYKLGIRKSGACRVELE